MRLIDADKMRESWLENGENEYVYDTNSMLESIDMQPTVDAVEVVHGEWIRTGAIAYRCSECNYLPMEAGTAFCPNCGAKMNGKKVE